MGSQRLGRDWVTEHTHARPQILISESAFGQIMILSSRSAIPRANKQMQPPTPHRPHHSHYPAQALSLGPLCPHKWPSCLWTSEPVIQEPDQPLNFTKKATEHKQEQWLAQLDRISIWAVAAAAAKSLQLWLTVWPQRQRPTRLPHPWDSPGKNTAVGCHFLLQCMKVKSESEVAQWCLTLSNPMDCSLPGSSIHGIFQARVLEWGAIAFSINLG